MKPKFIKHQAQDLVRGMESSKLDLNAQKARDESNEKGKPLPYVQEQIIA
jgi:hypothetical protein